MARTSTAKVPASKRLSSAEDLKELKKLIDKS